MTRIMMCVFVVLVAAGAALAPTRSTAAAQKVTDATKYKVVLKGDATVTAIGNQDGSNLTTQYNHSSLTANWTFTPQPTTIWLANVDSGSLVTKASAADNEDGMGHIHADEHFTWFDKMDTAVTPHDGTSDCNASVKTQMNVQYTATATPGGVDLTVDLVGIFRTDSGAEVPCVNTPDKRGGDIAGQTLPNSAFAFTWDPSKAEGARDTPFDPANQKLELFDTLQRFQIGKPSPAVLLKDGSRVTDAMNCTNLFLPDCRVTFTLNGDLTLTKICGGILGSDGSGTCTGGGGSGGGTEKNAPPKGGGSSGLPKLTNLKVTPHSFRVSAGNVHIAYTVDQVPTKTQLKVSGKITIAGHTIGPIPFQVLMHDNTTKSVSVPFKPSFGGRPLPPGTYTLEALPLNAKTSTPGHAVTTTFVITK